MTRARHASYALSTTLKGWEWARQRRMQKGIGPAPLMVQDPWTTWELLKPELMGVMTAMILSIVAPWLHAVSLGLRARCLARLRGGVLICFGALRVTPTSQKWNDVWYATNRQRHWDVSLVAVRVAIHAGPWTLSALGARASND